MLGKPGGGNGVDLAMVLSAMCAAWFATCERARLDDTTKHTGWCASL